MDVNKLLVDDYTKPLLGMSRMRELFSRAMEIEIGACCR